jgi:hypothetical protein
MLFTAVKRQPSQSYFERTENLKENKFNFGTIIYLKSRAERKAPNVSGNRPQPLLNQP